MISIEFPALCNRTYVSSPDHTFQKLRMPNRPHLLGVQEPSWSSLGRSNVRINVEESDGRCS